MSEAIDIKSAVKNASAKLVKHYEHALQECKNDCQSTLREKNDEMETLLAEDSQKNHALDIALEFIRAAKINLMRDMDHKGVELALQTEDVVRAARASGRQ